MRLFCVVVCPAVRLSGKRSDTEILLMFGVDWFNARGQFQDASYVPAAGDIIFFDWGNDGTIDHVGIVESVTNGVVNTIEGNSGDVCARQSYSMGSDSIYGYGVPAY